MSPAPAAFWVDRDYNREHASDGTSRYGAYLRDATFEPWTDNDQAVEWAVFAWQRATSPVMSPGYVRYHPRVLSAHLERSGWDGSLVAGVDLVSPWPDQLTKTLVRAVRLGETDIAARPYLLTTISLQFAVPSGSLPTPPSSRGPITTWLWSGRCSPGSVPPAR